MGGGFQDSETQGGEEQEVETRRRRAVSMWKPHGGHLARAKRSAQLLKAHGWLGQPAAADADGAGAGRAGWR